MVSSLGDRIVTLRIGLIWPQTGGLWTAGNLYFENLLKSLSLAGHRDEVAVIEPAAGLYSASTHGVREVAVSSFVPAPNLAAMSQSPRAS